MKSEIFFMQRAIELSKFGKYNVSPNPMVGCVITEKSKIISEGKPVITLTTDFPNSSRIAYIGNNQSNAGSTAANIIGKNVGKRSGSILMVMSMPYRCQQERELGFRKVLRSEFPNLKIKESVFNLDTSEQSYKYVKKYIKEHYI